jgi:hypothetical protein
MSVPFKWTAGANRSDRSACTPWVSVSLPARTLRTTAHIAASSPGRCVVRGMRGEQSMGRAGVLVECGLFRAGGIVVSLQPVRQHGRDEDRFRHRLAAVTGHVASDLAAAHREAHQHGIRRAGFRNHGRQVVGERHGLVVPAVGWQGPAVDEDDGTEGVCLLSHIVRPGKPVARGLYGRRQTGRRGGGSLLRRPEHVARIQAQTTRDRRPT